MNTENVKIKLVAVAKDEACYIPEWIFHHLYFGFDEIEILLNRTTDASAEVLAKIANVHKNVSYRFVDWIDTTPTAKFIQYISYANAFHEAKVSRKFSHIMFLDIDEFWLPKDLKTRPHTLLNSLKDASTVSFNWLNLLNEKEFNSLQRELYVQPAHTVKSIINLNADLKKIQLHLPELHDNSSFKGHLISNGSTFKSSPQERQRLHPSINLKNFDIYIAHRKFRSELEYTAMLLRGRPSDTAPFKFNRPGYIKADKNAFSVSLPEKEYDVYSQKRSAFYDEINVSAILQDAETGVRKKAQNCIDKLLLLEQKELERYQKDIFRIFSGINHPQVKSLRKASLKSAADLKPAYTPATASNAAKNTSLLSRAYSYFLRKVKR